MTVSPISIGLPAAPALSANRPSTDSTTWSGKTPKEAYKQFADSLESLSSATSDLRFLSSENSVSVHFEDIQCVLSFWHVLDLRFTAVPDNKGRADVLLSWSPETGVWYNRRKTIVLSCEALAVYCLDRLRTSGIRT